jgi:hypothetical protein
MEPEAVHETPLTQLPENPPAAETSEVVITEFVVVEETASATGPEEEHPQAAVWQEEPTLEETETIEIPFALPMELLQTLEFGEEVVNSPETESDVAQKDTSHEATAVEERSPVVGRKRKQLKSETPTRSSAREHRVPAKVYEPGMEKHTIGTGLKLEQVPAIVAALKHGRIDVLRKLHKILFGSKGKKDELKYNIAQWNGLPNHEHHESTAHMVDQLEKLAEEELKGVCRVLQLSDIDHGSEEELIHRITNYLKHPHLVQPHEYETTKKGTHRTQKKRKESEEDELDTSEEEILPSKNRKPVEPPKKKGKISKK